MALGPSFPCDGIVLRADPPAPLCLGFAGGPGSGPPTVAFPRASTTSHAAGCLCAVSGQPRSCRSGSRDDGPHRPLSWAHTYRLPRTRPPRKLRARETEADAVLILKQLLTWHRRLDRVTVGGGQGFSGPGCCRRVQE